jgi:hypothetical protein
MRAPLCGDNLVRLTFLDEAGRSRHEPTIVVAGVIVNGDRMYRRLEDRLRKIVVDAAPAGEADGLILHAADLFHGNRQFDKEKWPQPKRHEMLMEVARLPAEFELPVVFGHLQKGEYREDAAVKLVLAAEGQGKKEAIANRDKAHVLDIAEHVVAFARAEIAIERQMHRYSRDEICMLFAEDTDRVKPALKMAHAFMRDGSKIIGTEFEDVPELPLRKIVDTPHFADKADSVPLQLADTCAWLILRRLAKRLDTQPFFEAIAPQLLWNCVDFGEPMGAEQVGEGRLY